MRNAERGTRNATAGASLPGGHLHRKCDVADGAARSLEPLWTRLDREFRSASLNEANLFEMTFLAKPDHDTVKKVEPVLGSASTAAPVLIA